MFRTALALLVVLQSTAYGTNANGVKKNLNPETPIIFPDATQLSSSLPTRHGSDDDGPVECRNKLYCTEKPKNYPQEKFNNMFKNVNKVVSGVSPTDLGDRQGDPEEVDNCEVDIEFKPLYQVRASVDEPWRNVVQASDKNYVQNVRMEICRKEKAPCFTVFPKLPKYTTFCKQKVTSWSFLVEVEEGSDKTETMTVELPTCCSCHYKPT